MQSAELFCTEGLQDRDTEMGIPAYPEYRFTRLISRPRSRRRPRLLFEDEHENDDEDDW